MAGAGDSGPGKKRKYSHQQFRDLLKECGKNLQLVAEAIVEENTGEDWQLHETTDMLSKHADTVERIRKKLWHLDSRWKKREFRHNYNPDETVLNLSQFSYFGSQEEEVNHVTIVFLFLATYSSKQVQPSSQSSALSFSSGPQHQSTQQEEKEDPKPITDPSLSRDTRRRRVLKYRELSRQWCEEQQCSLAELAGLMVHLEYYPSNRALANIGWSLFSGALPSGPQHISVERGIWMMERMGISYSRYTELRLHLKDHVILPPEYLITKRSKEMMPALETYQNGVRADLSSCLSLTLEERLSTLDGSLFDDKVHISMTYGLDGSGCHANYRGIRDYSTEQLMNVCFSISEIFDREMKPIWSAAARGHSSPYNIRPLAIIPRKESDEFLKDFMPWLDAQVRTVEDRGLEIKLPNGRAVKVKIYKTKPSMIDGKMIVHLAQLGGCYCTMCDLSEEQCHDPGTIEAGFKINRSVDELRGLARFLMAGGDRVVREKDDYNVRKGVMAEPLTDADVTKVVPVSHSKINTVDWVVNKLIPKQNSHQKWGSKFKRAKVSTAERREEEEEKEKVKNEVQQQLGFHTGDGQHQLIGNAFHDFATDKARDVLASLIADRSVHSGFKFIHLRLSAIIRVLVSQHHEIDIVWYKELCTETLLKIREIFPWAVISPSLHRVLAHSWEIIANNDGKGLGSESEEPAEALNKFVRYFREHGARKMSTEVNFRDVWFHLWRRSSPLVGEFDREKKKRAIPMVPEEDESEIDTLVKSLFI